MTAHVETRIVREHELRKRLELACIDAANADQDGPAIEHLNHRLLDAAHELGRVLIAGSEPARSMIDPDPPMSLSLEEVQIAHVRKVLAECDGNKSEAAKILGCDRRSLYRWLEKAGMHTTRKRERWHTRTDNASAAQAASSDRAFAQCEPSDYLASAGDR